MAAGAIRVVAGATTVDIDPVELFTVSHRDDWTYRDTNGQLRAKDLPSKGKITEINISFWIGSLNRTDFSQLNTWMNAQTAVTVYDDGGNSTYPSSSGSFSGYISSLDENAYSEAAMADPPYSISILVDDFA